MPCTLKSSSTYPSHGPPNRSLVKQDSYWVSRLQFIIVVIELPEFKYLMGSAFYLVSSGKSREDVDIKQVSYGNSDHATCFKKQFHGNSTSLVNNEGPTFQITAVSNYGPTPQTSNPTHSKLTSFLLPRFLPSA